MKTKIITTLMIATAIAGSVTAQTSLKPVIGKKFVLTEVPAPAVTSNETFFGAGFELGNSNATINSIIPYSPAESYNFRKGDVITSIAGQKVTSDASAEKIIESLKPGKKVTVEYLRNGKLRQKKIKMDIITVTRNVD